MGPEPVLTEDDYAHVICERCVLAHPLLVDHLGSPGFMTILKSTELPQTDGSVANRSIWEVLGRLGLEQKTDDNAASTTGASTSACAGATESRKHDLPQDDTSTSDQPTTKKIKLSEDASGATSSCLLSPHPQPLATLVAARRSAVPPDHGFGAGRVDLFLPEDFRERWCRCAKVRRASLLGLSRTHALD